MTGTKKAEPVVIYHCRSGGAFAPVAAAIHLGELPEETPSSPAAILNVRFFGRGRAEDRGFLHFCGTDSGGHGVFVIGVGGDAELIVRIIRNAQAMAGGNPDDLLFVDCERAVRSVRSISAFVRLRLPFDRLLAGVVTGLYPRLVELVRDVRARVGT